MENQIKTSNETADKLAVMDALYRFAAGIDQRDKDLLMSAFAEDAISDFRPAGKKAGFEYPVLEGRETIVSALRGSLTNLDTTHSVSNPRVKIDGNKATLDALVEAQHVPSNDPTRHYLMKNQYEIEMIKQDELWVIKHVVIDNVWRTGDPNVLAGI
ncbi:nuclear transport factor 2 family protein [Leeuwenhoekiella marinoflava]|uniref:SnoaL-like protein n=2 Tax=Leeuwenhoekiella marinoflava TaxID=988 RepID=A0A4Q0PMR7_9FLAO|nr:nuclear transport factor 2 family protein [Leeuwenhoekiella marinoflava]RXG31836.1 SnoaL-like protein [Leeuwenhoekiella marinoflava]SHF03287.1 SnoaL-like domain-containing protein [Leeuwenhoekiella marinoflava DSM 3653]